MDRRLTEQESAVLAALTEHLQEKGYMPSQRELARRVGLKSPNTVDYHLKKLERKGLVRCRKGQSRAVTVLRQTLAARIPEALGRVPLLGTVPAGVPNFAANAEQEYIEVDSSLVKGQSLALRVRGDSMKDAGIFEGDVVIVRLQRTAENGEIVVARYGEDATVKTFRMLRGRPYLFPANEKYEPLPADRAEIVGKVTGVIRRYH